MGSRVDGWRRRVAAVDGRYRGLVGKEAVGCGRCSEAVVNDLLDMVAGLQAGFADMGLESEMVGIGVVHHSRHMVG